MGYKILPIFLLCLVGALESQQDVMPFLSQEKRVELVAKYGKPGDSLEKVWQAYINDKITEVREHSRLSKPLLPFYVPAEYNRADGVCFSWKGHKELLKSLIQEVSSDTKAYVITDDIDRVRRELEAYGCNMQNIEILKMSLDTIWIRDYGPWFVYTQNGDREIVDLIYNRPRPLDDQFPSLFANHYLWKCHPALLVLAGGNLILGEDGIAIITDAVFDPAQGGNGDISLHELKSYLKDYFNCHTVYIVEALQKDGTGHIDIFCKLLDQCTLLVGSYASPQDGAGDNYQILNRNAQKLSECRNGLGQPFKIHRIPMPPYDGNTYTYTNSLIINDKVLIPLYNKEQDKEAMRIYTTLLPRCKVIGFDCNSIIDVNGAIHCITQLVMSDPLEITHTPVKIAHAGQKMKFEACIQTSYPLKPNGVYLLWKMPSQKDYISLLMTSTNQCAFFTELTMPGSTCQIQYYLRAETVIGIHETLPDDNISPNFYTIQVMGN